MKEAEFIKEIKKLRKIQPRKDWVVLTKTEILGETPRISPFLFFKPALVGALSLGLLIGLFFVSQNSLPGELLYPIKKLSEKSQRIFVSQEKKPEFQLKLTEKRLAELQEILEKNQTRRLSAAISELKTSKNNTDKEVSKLIKENPATIKKIATLIEKNNTKEKQIFSSLGLQTQDEKEPNEKLIVEYLIKDLEGSSLTDQQTILLEEAKKYFEEGNYSLALSRTLEASQIK